MHSKKRIILWSVIAAVLLAGVISVCCLLFNRPLQLTQPTFIYIDGDDTADSVYVKIQHDLHGTRLAGFRMLSRFKSYDKHIHTGAYRFDAQTNTLTLFRRLSSGYQTPVKVTIPIFWAEKKQETFLSDFLLGVPLCGRRVFSCKSSGQVDPMGRWYT